MNTLINNTLYTLPKDFANLPKGITLIYTTKTRAKFYYHYHPQRCLQKCESCHSGTKLEENQLVPVTCVFSQEVFTTTFLLNLRSAHAHALERVWCFSY